MTYFPDSLFTLSLNFVVKHVNAVESFVGFPSIVAEKIFHKFALEYKVEKDDKIENIMNKFSDAYENLVLERLNLSERLLILNEYFETIIIISRFVTELCVCNCFLGENHELLSHISELKCLRKLCMMNNLMNNSSLRLLTLRIRMYGVGGKEVEILNLADNSFSDDIIPWLSAFPKLQFLNISGSTISEKGIQTLARRYNLKQVCERGKHQTINNEGWATIILEKWIEELERRRNNKEKKPNIKKNLTVMKPLFKQSSNISLVFRKMSSKGLKAEEKYLSPAPKKRKISPEFRCEDIEEDLFSQYK